MSIITHNVPYAWMVTTDTRCLSVRGYWSPSATQSASLYDILVFKVVDSQSNHVEKYHIPRRLLIHKKIQSLLTMLDNDMDYVTIRTYLEL